MPYMNKKLLLLLLLSVALILTACSAILQSSQLFAEETSDKRDEPQMTLVTEVASSATPLIPTHTYAPQTTPIPAATLTPTLSPPYPLTIEYLRQQEYPGSEVVIEQTLDPGVNYDRYIASYRSEGLKINALLTVPFGEKPESGWPVVVFNHGYIPPDEYRTTERYIDYVDAFARNGYIVFRSDYRGHDNSEGVARGAYGNPDYTIDVLNAVAAIKMHPDSDPDRIGMWGHSLGGYITLRALVVSEDIKAGVIWAGVVASYPDLISKWRRPNSIPTPVIPVRARWWRTILNDTFGSPEENPDFWDSISANSYLENLSGPLQLHHGTADTSVPIEFSTTLTKQIRDVGGSVEYYTYEGDNHNISINFGDAIYRSISFFDKYVKESSPQ